MNYILLNIYLQDHDHDVLTISKIYVKYYDDDDVIIIYHVLNEIIAMIMLVYELIIKEVVYCSFYLFVREFFSCF